MYCAGSVCGEVERDLDPVEILLGCGEEVDGVLDAFRHQDPDVESVHHRLFEIFFHLGNNDRYKKIRGFYVEVWNSLGGGP